MGVVEANIAFASTTNGEYVSNGMVTMHMKSRLLIITRGEILCLKKS